MSWRPVLDGLLWHAEVATRGGWPLGSVAIELRGGGVSVVERLAEIVRARL